MIKTDDQRQILDTFSPFPIRPCHAQTVSTRLRACRCDVTAPRVLRTGQCLEQTGVTTCNVQRTTCNVQRTIWIRGPTMIAKNTIVKNTIVKNTIVKNTCNHNCRNHTPKTMHTNGQKNLVEDRKKDRKKRSGKKKKPRKTTSNQHSTLKRCQNRMALVPRALLQKQQQPPPHVAPASCFSRNGFGGSFQRAGGLNG
jgi:hypothetical protein